MPSQEGASPGAPPLKILPISIFIPPSETPTAFLDYSSGLRAALPWNHRINLDTINPERVVASSIFSSGLIL
ncbi:MAG: hypothetical protein ACRD8U_03965, partial [Pyrinomonadaceae bacterium]